MSPPTESIYHILLLLSLGGISRCNNLATIQYKLELYAQAFTKTATLRHGHRFHKDAVARETGILGGRSDLMFEKGVMDNESLVYMRKEGIDTTKLRFMNTMIDYRLAAWRQSILSRFVCGINVRDYASEWEKYEMTGGQEGKPSPYKLHWGVENDASQVRADGGLQSQGIWRLNTTEILRTITGELEIDS